MRKALTYGTVMIVIYVLVVNGTGSGTVITSGRPGPRRSSRPSRVADGPSPVLPGPRISLRWETFGPEPVGAAGAIVLAGYTHGQMDGSRLGGFPHFGMKGSPAVTFTGYVSSPQRFVGAAQMGASRNLSVQKYPALPAPVAPAALPTWLQDWTQLKGWCNDRRPRWLAQDGELDQDPQERGHPGRRRHRGGHRPVCEVEERQQLVGDGRHPVLRQSGNGGRHDGHRRLLRPREPGARPPAGLPRPGRPGCGRRSGHHHGRRRSRRGPMAASPVWAALTGGVGAVDNTYGAGGPLYQSSAEANAWDLANGIPVGQTLAEPGGYFALTQQAAENLAASGKPVYAQG